MYIVEFFIKKFLKKPSPQTLNPLEMPTEEDYESCEHLFMPIDSTGETLSCTKCGLLKKRSELKNKNFFEL